MNRGELKRAVQGVAIVFAWFAFIAGALAWGAYLLFVAPPGRPVMGIDGNYVMVVAIVLAVLLMGSS